jgi:hypothetical protein
VVPKLPLKESSLPQPRMPRARVVPKMLNQTLMLTASMMKNKSFKNKEKLTYLNYRLSKTPRENIHTSTCGSKSKLKSSTFCFNRRESKIVRM